MNSIFRKTAAALLAACVMGSAMPLTTYADTAKSGWVEENGNRYYYKADGSKAVKSTNIDGVRYKFGSDGVCKGTYTGWAASGGKKFYYDEGVKQYGWTLVKESWYYIDKKQGRLTGEQTIDGAKYNLQDSGKWDCNTEIVINGKARSIYSLFNKDSYGKLDPKIYAGMYYDHGFAVVMSVDGKAEKKIQKLYPGMPGIMYREAKFSKYELDKIREYLSQSIRSKNPSLCNGHDTNVQNNLVEIYADERQLNDLYAYIDTLPDKSCVKVIKEKNVEYFDDSAVDVAAPGTWGVTMEAKNVSATGLDLVITQGDGNRTGETMTGQEYRLQQLDGKAWKDVPYITGSYGWDDVGLLISEAEGGRREDTHNWRDLYGKLAAGHYRILKEITDFRGTGDSDVKVFSAEFDVTA